MFLIGNKLVRFIFGEIFALSAVIAVILLSVNMNNHFGKKKTAVIKTKLVYTVTSAQSPIKAVAVKKIGKNNFILVYKNAKNDAQVNTHFVPDTSKIVKATNTNSNCEKNNVTKAQVKTVTTKWIYKSSLWKNFFYNKNEDNRVSIKHVLQVPKTW
ncbi:hypothetical protein LES9216_00645 [Leuconostoc suionicum]|uniref:DUF4811 domain-containing protein n=1 Tax=Leuconostoc suionicum TaxID=1511761 RepID=A0A2N9K838_9LACO|nr:DUF4811 domain-containing protein [Leuconostoc suionicum]SPD91518.1 hypothetical protein LES8486_00498 [Leuconostoc suionicum]SPE06743.1 hypothetical protein LES9216_00645 [Leuconostoc suionicum]SPH03250.1 hypothetical protein LES8484_00498 [Leuconostoc suionicum]